MSLSDLLELGLDLANGLVLELLNFLEGTPDHTESLRVNPGGCQDLISLGILGLKRLLDSFELLLENEVA